MHGEAHGKSGACIFLDAFPKVYISGPFEDVDLANTIADYLSKSRNSPTEIERNAEAFSEWFERTIVEPYEDSETIQ